MSFRLLYSPLFDEDELDDDTTQGLEHFSQSLLTMLNMGLFGAFSVDGFKRTANRDLTSFFFVGFMVFVNVVALNALIAILGDSFDQAQEKKTASRAQQRAELIVEYYDEMGEEKQKDIEQATRWIHKLVPESLLETAYGDDDAWKGRLFAIRDAIHKTITEKTSGLDEKMNRMEEETSGLDEKINRIETSVKDIQQEMQEKLTAILAALEKPTKISM